MDSYRFTIENQRHSFCQSLSESVWYGPPDRDFDFSDLVRLETHNWSWSPCGEQRHLTLKTSMVLNNRRKRSGDGLISTDSIDAEIAHVYALVWWQ